MLLAVVVFAGCGNYSNEDLEFMNAVPARDDLDVEIPRSMVLPANEAELSRLTHDVVAAFNGALVFLDLGDVIRTYPPSSRIPNGRIWGPFPVERLPAWQWRFRITRDPAMPESFEYEFQLARVGRNAESDWTTLFDGWFLASSGVRRGVGQFRIQTERARLAGYPIEVNEKGEMLKELVVDYATADFPISVKMNMTLNPGARDGDFTSEIYIHYEYEQQESGAGRMLFSGTDSRSGWTLSIISRWLATGRGRADATAMDGAAIDMTRTQCWDDSFVATYNYTPWSEDPTVENHGDPSSCPVFSTP